MKKMGDFFFKTMAGRAMISGYGEWRSRIPEALV